MFFDESLTVILMARNIVLANAISNNRGFVYFTIDIPKNAKIAILGITPNNVKTTKGINGILVIPAAIENTLKGTIGKILPIKTLIEIGRAHV